MSTCQAGNVDWVDVNEMMFYRLKPDGQKISAALEAGPAGFAVAKFGLISIETTAPNLLLGTVLKRPAAAIKKPAATVDLLKESDGEEGEEEEKEEEEELGNPEDGSMFPPGCKVEKIRRSGSQAGKAYKLYTSPEGQVFRSLRAVQASWQELE